MQEQQGEVACSRGGEACHFFRSGVYTDFRIRRTKQLLGFPADVPGGTYKLLVNHLHFAELHTRSSIESGSPSGQLRMEEASEIECTTASCKLVRVMINGRQQRDMG